MAEPRTKERWPKDNGMDIPEGEWDAAVSCLVRHVTLQSWAQIKETIGRKGSRWYVGEGQRLGRAVRYLLTRGGFRWGAVCLQANWFHLVEEAAKRVYFARVELNDS